MTRPVGQALLACNRKFRMVDIENIRNKYPMLHADAYN